MNYSKTILGASIIAALGLTGAAFARNAVQNPHQNADASKDAAHQQKENGSSMDDVDLFFGQLLARNGAVSQQGARSDAASNDEQDDQDQVEQLGSLEVKGIRGSLSRSIGTKRTADAIVDAVSAKDIGQFPATNVAEALTHIPGVTIDRNMPALEKVSINGLDPNLNLTLLNGHPVAQAIILYGQSPNRGFNFSLLPAEIVGNLEVYKSYEASLPAGGLGGTIIVHTRDPLDLDPDTIAASAGYLYNAQSSDGGPNVSVFYSTRNQDSTFGFNVGVQHFENRINRQGLEVFGYDAASAYPNAGGKHSPDALVPEEVNAAYFTQDLKRDSLYANFQFEPSSAFTSALKVFYLDVKADNVNQSLYPYNWSTADAVTSLKEGANGIVTGGSVKGAACTNAYFQSHPDTRGSDCGPARTYTDIFARGSHIKTKGADLKLGYTGQSWGISGQLGWNESNNDIVQNFKEPFYTGGYDFDLSSGYTFNDRDKATNPDYWIEQWPGNYIQKPYQSRQNYARVDFSVDLNSVINELVFGVRYAKHWEAQHLRAYAGLDRVAPAQYLNGLTDLSGLSDLDASQDAIQHIKRSGFDTIANVVQNSSALQQNIADGVFNASLFYSNSWDINQTRQAAYVQANFNNGLNLRGNFGARFVHVKNVAHGWMAPPTCVDNNQLPGDCNFGSQFGYNEQEKTTSNVLPAFNIAYTPDQNVVLRAAGSETLGFNSYSQLVPSFFANGTALTATASNPDLDPYKSVNVSLSAEWYFSNTSLLSLSVFNKNIINYVVTRTEYRQHYNPLFSTPGADLGSTAIQNNCDIDTGVCRFAVTGPFNGGQARVVGFTAGYQQAFGDSGFGLRANYTFSDGTVAGGGRLPYNSKDSYTISPFYSKGPINASISYNWRSDYTAAGYVAGAAPNIVDDYKSLNATFSYAFNDHWTLQLAGMNLLNSTYYQFGPTAHNQLFTKYNTGRVYSVSIHAQF